MEKIPFSCMTETPADAFCPNGQMQLLAGAICENGVIKPLSYPEKLPADDAEVSICGCCVSLGADGLSLRAADGADLGSGPGFPELVFGMELAGALSMPYSFILPAAMAPSTSSSTTHPTAKPIDAAEAAACATVHKAIAAAIDRQIHTKGYFHQPFFVRYALRMHDDDCGTTALPSAPVLMLPSTMPPCIAVDSVLAGDDDEHKRVLFSSTSFKFFRLKCRVAKGIDEKWKSRVASVDIYISEPICTYDADSVTNAGIVSYSSLTGGRDFMGVWAESGGNYADRYLSRSGLASVRAWDLAPNHSFEGELSRKHDFHLVASIRIDDLVESDKAVDVLIASTAPEAVRKGEVLEANPLAHFLFFPEALASYGGELWLGGGKVGVPKPLPLRTMMSEIAGEDYAEESTAMAVSSHQGYECRSSSSRMNGAPRLSQAMPRYLWHPDPEARKLIVNQSGVNYEFPLIRCGEGACWFGGLGTEPECYKTVEEGAVEVGKMGLYSASDRVFAGKPLALHEKSRISGGRITALKSALTAVSAGQFGQYPLYAFADSGVWALTLDGACRKVASGAFANMIAVKGGVAYVGAEGLMMLEGAKCKLLGGATRRKASISLRSLPRLAQLTGVSELPSLAATLSDCTLAYDEVDDLLWVKGNGGMAYAYSLAADSWGIALKGWGCRRLMITRPLKLSDTGEKLRLKRVEIIGNLHDAQGGVILYGSNDLARWSIVGSTCGSHIASIAGSGWRYYKIAIDALVPEGESIDGVTIM